MFLKWFVLLLVVTLAVLLATSPPDFANQYPPSPQSLWHAMQIRAVTPPGNIPPDRTPIAGPAPALIASVATRIDRDRLEVRVYQNGQLLTLFPRFHELIVSNPIDHQKELDAVVGKSVAVLPSEKDTGREDIYLGVAGGAGLCLADNIYIVRQVVRASRKNSIGVQVDGVTQRLKPGQLILLI